MEQVVRRSDLVVLVPVEALHRKISFEAEFVKVAQHGRLDWNLVFADYQTL